MNSLFRWPLAVLSVAVCCTAGAEGPLTKALGQPGEVILEDHFDRSAPGGEWKVAKGDWTIVDGSLVGRELTADKHAAVAAIGGTHRNSILHCRFQLAGAEQLHVSLNQTKGHLFRVVINARGLTMTLDKDKADAASKAQVLAKAEGAVEPHQWHTLQLEMVGDRAVARLDDRLVVAGQHADLDCDKPGYRFVVNGESVRIDDLVVTAVKPL